MPWLVQFVPFDSGFRTRAVGRGRHRCLPRDPGAQRGVLPGALGRTVRSMSIGVVVVVNGPDVESGVPGG